MEVQEDFRELLALFNDHKVDFVIVAIAHKRAMGRKKDLADLEALAEE